MGIVVVGSVAFDSLETPFGKRNNVLGGSATYFSFSASFFADVKLTATVGSDFPEKYLRLFKRQGIDIKGLKKEKGKTFSWKGKYGYDLNTAQTVYTRLNVFEKFSPQLPPSYKKEKFIFLANIDPDLQESVLNQIRKPKLVACDTMNHWINDKRHSLVKLLKKVDVLLLNDAEARQLTEEVNLFKAIKWVFKRGPEIVIIKKGEHGVILATKQSLFCIPAYPLETVFDPTGAGDTFAGGFLGSLSRFNKLDNSALRRAVVYGTVMASFAVEDFGPERLISITRRDIEARYRMFRKLTCF